MPASPHKRTLYIMLADHFILHAQVISTSPLPATLCPLYLYTHIYISLSLSPHLYPTHRLAHEPPPPSLLTDSQHAAGKRASLFEGCPFSRPTPPRNGAKKGTPPPDLCLLLSMSTPVGVAAMSTSPRDTLPDVTPSLPLVRQVFARAY